ncbi:MAG: PIN domain-containing protein [Gemmatimonadales bacterium]|nr:PIN domain-containing protein [Gemmatimonadales bacterium]
MGPLLLHRSALLAYFRRAPGAERVEAAIDGAIMSSVDRAEVLEAFARHGVPLAEADAILHGTGLLDAPADSSIASTAARLLAADDALTSGDAFCLATAERLGLPVLAAAPHLGGRLRGVEVWALA